MKNASYTIKANNWLLAAIIIGLFAFLVNKAAAGSPPVGKENPSGWMWSSQRELSERQLGISSELMPPISGVGPALIAAYNKRAGTNGIVSVPRVIQDSLMMEAYKNGEIEFMLRIQPLATSTKMWHIVRRLGYDKPVSTIVGYRIVTSPGYAKQTEAIYDCHNSDRLSCNNWAAWLQGNEAQDIIAKYGYGTTSWNDRI